MSEEANSANPNPGNQSAGGKIPLFVPGFGTRPSIFSASDMNRLVSRLNALLNGRINIQQAAAQADGTSTPNGKWTLSDENLIIDLFLNNAGGGSSGSSSVQLFQVTTAYTLGDQYVICGTATATASNTYTNLGDSIKVALPFKLRTNTYNSPNIFPNYAVNDIIIATQPTGGTGVFVGGSDVLWQDVNFDKRYWQDYDYFNLTAMSANYFTATSVLSGLSVSIAKNPSLQNSITSETIDTVSWAYTYQTTGTYAFVTRKAVGTVSGTSYTEYQVVCPRYLSTSIIKARIVPTGLTDGSSNPIFWQEESERSWYSRASQAGFENT